MGPRLGDGHESRELSNVMLMTLRSERSIAYPGTLFSPFQYPATGKRYRCIDPHSHSPPIRDLASTWARLAPGRRIAAHDHRLASRNRRDAGDRAPAG
jgi:hypothetical protein